MTPPLPPFAAHALTVFGARLRRAVAVDHVATLLTAITLAVWASFASDFTFELPLAWRVLVLVAGGVTATVFLWSRVVRWYVFGFPPCELAAAIERRAPSFDGSLLTAVESDTLDRASPRVAAMCAHAAEVLAREPSALRVSWRGVRRRLAIAVLIITPTLFLAATHPTTAAIWWSRNIGLTQRAWGEATDLIVEGFDSHGVCRIPRGETLTLTVRARDGRRRTPDQIRLLIGRSRIIRERIVIDQFQIDFVEGNDYRTFTRTLPEVTESFDLVVLGGGLRRDGLRVEAMPRPTLTRCAMRLTSPDYLAQEPTTLAASTGRTSILDGTAVAILAETSHAVSTVEMRARSGLSDSATPLAPKQPTPTSIEVELGPLRDETTLEVTLHDVHGISSLPITLAWTIRRDTPPLVAAHLVGIGSSITPEAVIPIEGTISDDHALETVSTHFTIARLSEQPISAHSTQGSESGSHLLASSWGRREYVLTSSLSAESLALRDGDTLTLWVEATDRCTLDQATNTDANAAAGQCGRSEVWTLTVVAREKLLATLETQEIVLRQRLEGSIREIAATRAAMDSSDDASLVRERLVRDAQRLRYEMETLANSLDRVRRERQNNRLLDASSGERLTGVTTPLRDLAERLFPEAERELARLGTLPPPDAESHRRAARERLDTIAATMAEVRDRMLALESYSELLERLRGVLKLQDEVRKATLDEQKESLRRLAE